MTIPAIPLPRLKYLYRSLFVEPSSGVAWLENQDENETIFYHRGRWALAEGVRALLEERGKKEGRVWLPGYFCNEALAPLRKMPVRLSFYPIKENLHPDWQFLNMEVENSPPPDIFILVHYFGMPNDLEGAKDFCREHQIDLMEDAAHCLIPGYDLAHDSMSVFSPWKLLPIPEGGILVSPKKLSGRLRNDMDPSGTDIFIKWLIRRLTQRMMMILGISWHRFRKKKEHILNSQSLEKTSDLNSNVHCNTYTRKLLSVMEKEIEDILGKRRENYETIYHTVKELNGVQPLFTTFPDKTCPYVFPMLLPASQTPILRQLRDKGTSAVDWPDLPQEVLIEKEKYKTAIRLKDRIILLPVHQDITEKELTYLLRCLKEAFPTEGSA